MEASDICRSWRRRRIMARASTWRSSYRYRFAAMTTRVGEQPEATVVVNGGNGHPRPLGQSRNGEGALQATRRTAAAGYIRLSCPR